MLVIYLCHEAPKVKNLLRLNKYFLKYKWHLLGGTVFVFLSNYFKIKIPQTVKVALNSIFELVEAKKASDTPGEFFELFGDQVIRYSLYVVGFSMVMGLFMFLMRQTIIVMSRLIEYDLRKEIFDHYEKLDTAFYKSNKTGDLMSRVAEDVGKVRMYLGPAILYGLNLIGLCVLVVYAMLQVNVELTIYTLVPLPFLSLSIYYVSRLINKRSEEIQKQLSVLTANSQEVYSGIRVVKSYRVEDRFRKRFTQVSEDFKEKSMSLAKVNAFFFPLMILIISLSTLLTIYISGRLVGEGKMMPGTIAEFIIYVNYLTWPFTSIGWIASIIQQAEASSMRINEILDTEPTILNASTRQHNLLGKVEFKNVTFVYPDTGIKALDDVSFVLEPGQKLAVMGRTASGKSTICELITRMYDVTSGSILIDGIPIDQIDLNSLRSQIGYVPQDGFLFSDTIENNIRFGAPDTTRDDVEFTAMGSDVHQDILQFSDGYETMVGERGVTLSGGQKQRVSIARALIKRPDLVLLDDCLSAVDTKTEKTILGYLSEELKGKTTIIITHRILHYISFDAIMIIDKGRIVEFGNHQDLLNNGGYYYDMVENQKYD